MPRPSSRYSRPASSSLRRSSSYCIWDRFSPENAPGNRGRWRFIPTYTVPRQKGLGDGENKVLLLTKSSRIGACNLLLFQQPMRSILTVITAMILFPSCQQGQSKEPALSRQLGYTFYNVAYGTDSAQRMDVYLPAGRDRQSTPVMLLVHGGGWSGGNKSEFNAYIEDFRRRMPGYAFFNINYRLVNGRGTLLPQQEADVAAALRFVQAGAARYGIDTGRVVLLGASAGAHLALLQAYKHPHPSVRAVVDFFGPTDLVRMAEKPWHPLVPLALQTVIGKTYREAPEAYRAASPLAFVRPQNPPTLILQGGADNVVHPDQSRALAERLEASGVAHQLVLFPSARHGWQGTTLHRSFDTVQRFLERHVP
ncbi:alpha/beta hydrolase [Flaviaesturariibacter aridisoli]|uniref:Alpha/beta hydrolase n=2 Tax=Flaviaesturariibacter aridisoli TaxID=2545761 RepID=A0A4V2WMA2_9BACT|nr:alpha/beta hydrolase [Flaviaesturariibacter aridisoli]